MRPTVRLPALERGTRVLVVGLGVHGGGAATVRALVRRGCRVRVTDAKSARELAPSIRQLRAVRFERRFGAHRIADVRWAAVVVQNPGVPRNHPLILAARRLKRPVVNDAVLFLAWAPGPVVAVTGTRGKSTTVALAAAMLGAPRAGLPGEPLLELIPKLRSGQTSVAEFSSWQCELLPNHRAAPDAAVVTNISPDHLNRYPSFASYVSAKASLLRGQSLTTSFAVLNREDAVVRKLGQLVRGHRAWFSLPRFAEEDGVFIERGWFTVRAKGRSYRIAPRSALKLPGEHMTANALAAVAAAWWMAPNRTRIRRALRSFRGLPGRQEVVAIRHGITFVNDTTATSPAGTVAALNVYHTKRPVLIAGGVDKGLDFARLAKTIAARCTAVVLLPGTGTDRLRLLLPSRVRTVDVPSMTVAVRTASRLARPGSVVLLSPSAASFNLFRHEYDRGDAFAAAVRRLP